MTDYIRKIVEYAKINKYPTSPSSSGPNPAISMSHKHNFQQDSSRVNNGSPKSGSPRGESDNNFDNVTQTPITGRLSVKIVEGRKLNVSNFQSRPYCVVEFERNEFVTREAIRDSDLPNTRGKPMDFLDLVRSATSPVWNQKAVL